MNGSYHLVPTKQQKTNGGLGRASDAADNVIFGYQGLIAASSMSEGIGTIASRVGVLTLPRGTMLITIKYGILSAILSTLTSRRFNPMFLENERLSPIITELSNEILELREVK